MQYQHFAWNLNAKLMLPRWRHWKITWPIRMNGLDIHRISNDTSMPGNNATIWKIPFKSLRKYINILNWFYSCSSMLNSIFVRNRSLFRTHELEERWNSNNNGWAERSEHFPLKWNSIYSFKKCNLYSVSPFFSCNMKEESATYDLLIQYIIFVARRPNAADFFHDFNRIVNKCEA